MRTVRLIGRGLSDTLEHLLPFSLLTLGWWVCVLLVLTAPGGTVALLAMTDPRRAVDRPEWREAVVAVRANLRRGWLVALVTVPVLAVLLANLSYYSEGASRWSVLVPLWTLLLVLAFALAFYAFAVVALTDASALVAIKRAAFLVALRPLRAIALIVVVAVLITLGTALVVPIVMFIPALVAALVNRTVLDGLGLPVADPLAPTEERAAEEQRRAAASKFGP